MGSVEQLRQSRLAHAKAIAEHGGLEAALAAGALSVFLDTSLSELIVLGLLRQNVRIFFSVFGHGSTELGEVLRVYAKAGLVKVFGVRNEIEASHAATALRWTSGKKAAVITSIGPGALQALAASIVPVSDGIGVWYLMGDETTEDEGFNMQQIPKQEQQSFLKLMSTMGKAYAIHTPLALSTALRRGLNTVDHPYKAGPFFLLMPMNTQPMEMSQFNLRELPEGAPPRLGAAPEDAYAQAASWISEAERVLVKVGGGGTGCTSELVHLLELSQGVSVTTPIATGAVPFSHPQNMGVGGSKGSLCGNYAMDEADLLIAIGTRAVCQSDCSRTGYPKVQHVININADLDDATHYQNTLALVGDAALTLQKLNLTLDEFTSQQPEAKKDWILLCTQKKAEWEAFKQERYDHPLLLDEFWTKPVLTQSAAIKTALDWSQDKADVIRLFDAGDVQANGFQIVEDEYPGRTFTDTGASYMGFAVSAVLATAALEDPPFFLAFTGDGSLTMNPQILIDGAEHSARGCILLLDNNRMAAISGLQEAQYENDFATSNQKPIDYVKWASSVPGVLALHGGESMESLKDALDQAYAHPGLSLIQVPVYYGPDPLGGMGVFGRWNVGNWVNDTQALRHKIGL
jgi:3D-(3,5/4)-trihydroxycyclohexane-1,2-dione acylhydrolase (decyclizing)